MYNVWDLPYKPCLSWGERNTHTPQMVLKVLQIFYLNFPVSDKTVRLLQNKIHRETGKSINN